MRNSISTPFSPWPYAIILTFVLLAAFDAVIVYKAVQSKTGTVTDSPYDDALIYEKVVQAKKAVITKGLTLQMQYYKDGFKASVTGQLIPGKYSLRLNFRKPDNSKLDKVLELQSETLEFFAQNTNLEAGLWLLEALLTGPSGEEFLFESKEMVNGN